MSDSTNGSGSSKWDDLETGLEVVAGILGVAAGLYLLWTGNASGITASGIASGGVPLGVGSVALHHGRGHIKKKA